ncbi:hypothetical protein RJT34_05852 [Clitoria ternatea]|uniref:Uncharacterized protein n=1 Tax=Clitoria ternatea TaxID=43366 RepID=A0AAN9PTD0_CLITE
MSLRWLFLQIACRIYLYLLILGCTVLNCSTLGIRSFLFPRIVSKMDLTHEESLVQLKVDEFNHFYFLARSVTVSTNKYYLRV